MLKVKKDCSTDGLLVPCGVEWEKEGGHMFLTGKKTGYDLGGGHAQEGAWECGP